MGQIFSCVCSYPVHKWGRRCINEDGDGDWSGDGNPNRGWEMEMEMAIGD